MRFQIDKNLVKDKFLESIETYDNHAVVQKKMAWELLNFVTERYGKKFNHILEIGSGTGLLTKEIVDNIEFKKLITNDLSSNYNGIIRGYVSNLNIDYKFIEGDAETSIEFPENNDLIISNATFQWFENINKFVIQSHKLLNKNGIFAFTSFGTNNFIEISTVLKKGLDYMPLHKILEGTEKYYETVFTHSYQEKLFFNNPFEVLKHIKNTGVNATGNKENIKAKQFSDNYIKLFKHNNGVSLTYNPIFIILKKI